MLKGYDFLYFTENIVTTFGLLHIFLYLCKT